MIKAIYRGLEDCDDPFFKIGDTYILYESWVGRIDGTMQRHGLVLKRLEGNL